MNIKIHRKLSCHEIPASILHQNKPVKPVFLFHPLDSPEIIIENIEISLFKIFYALL